MSLKQPPESYTLRGDEVLLIARWTPIVADLPLHGHNLREVRAAVSSRHYVPSSVTTESVLRMLHLLGRTVAAGQHEERRWSWAPGLSPADQPIAECFARVAFGNTHFLAERPRELVADQYVARWVLARLPDPFGQTEIETACIELVNQGTLHAYVNLHRTAAELMAIYVEAGIADAAGRLAPVPERMSSAEAAPLLLLSVPEVRRAVAAGELLAEAGQITDRGLLDKRRAAPVPNLQKSHWRAVTPDRRDSHGASPLPRRVQAR